MLPSKLTHEDFDLFRKNNVGQHLLEVAKDFQKRALEGFIAEGMRGCSRPTRPCSRTFGYRARG